MDKDQQEAMVARANDEREKLFQRYDHGREPGAVIDEWEDPAFEVYHQTDRYGFIHDKRLPQKSDPNEAKAKAIEMERVKKWLKMTSKWDSKKTMDVLHKRIYKGIPDKMRSRVWIKLLNIEQTMNDNKNVYQKMLKLARQWSTEARQIDSDVNRQFREHLFYRERYNIKQKSLFNILTAYSMYNMEVGYCQGMSGVAGVLLMYMNEEEAFWALCTILSDKRYAMHGLYIEGFPKLTRFLAHHDNIISKFLPKLKKHFDQYNLDSILYSLKWFFVIFIERIPFSLCLRVWDIYLLDGERVVTAMAYTILRLHKTKLLKLKDMDLIVQYIQTKLHKDFGYDDDTVIKMLEQSMDELRKAKLDLPPPAGPNEFPKKPFGVFVEPNFEAKVGIRKSIFSDTEKEVTDTVILRRETTVQELNESQVSDGAIGGSNSQMNNADGMKITKPDRVILLHASKAIPRSTTKHQFNAGVVPESEDGGSLLGSSRKSLADTSVTSTADLSVFSGGQRSQQAFDICVDDARSIISEGDNGEGESSPGSAFCSLSIVGRTPSAMMITPRAMSPQDVVRIYVPAAPPGEESPPKAKVNGSPPSKTLSGSTISLRSAGTIRTLNGTLNGSRDGLNSSNRNSIISTGGGISGDVTPVRRSMYRSDEELRFAGIASEQKSTSSSRRGSLSRKSPSSLLSLENKLLMECSHTQASRRRSSDISNKVKLNISLENVSKSNIATELDASNRKVLMTSFEELANKQDAAFSLQRATAKSIAAASSAVLKKNNSFTPDDDNFTMLPAVIGSRYVSESNIEYKPFSTSSGGSIGSNDHDYHHPRQRRPSATGITTSPPANSAGSPSDYDVFSAKDSSKQYSRFFGGEVHTIDDDYDDPKKSSDESSSSPNGKSITSTPVNETVPLLLASPTSPTATYQPYQDRDVENTPNSKFVLNRTYSSSSSNHAVMTSSSSSLTKKVSRPSRIPLFHKAMSPVDDYSSTTVLPPVEVVTSSHNISSSHIHHRRIGSGGSNTGIVDFDSRIAAPLGGAYEFNRNLNQRSTTSSVGSASSGIAKAPTADLNKIRIKINQNQRN